MPQSSETSPLAAAALSACRRLTPSSSRTFASLISPSLPSASSSASSSARRLSRNSIDSRYRALLLAAFGGGGGSGRSEMQPQSRKASAILTTSPTTTTSSGGGGVSGGGGGSGDGASPSGSISARIDRSDRSSSRSMGESTTARTPRLPFRHLTSSVRCALGGGGFGSAFGSEAAGGSPSHTALAFLGYGGSVGGSVGGSSGGGDDDEASKMPTRSGSPDCNSIFFVIATQSDLIL